MSDEDKKQSKKAEGAKDGAKAAKDGGGKKAKQDGGKKAEAAAPAHEEVRNPNYVPRFKKHYLDVAENAARKAGELLRKNFHRPQHVNTALAHDIKLAIDVQTQELITKALLKQFPHHALYGEEGIVGDQSSEHQWVVDPLDGTVNYFYQIPHFCVSIALRLKGEIIVGVIYDPRRDEMWAAQKGEKPRLNGQHFRVSDRTNLAEAVISVGLAKTDKTIDSNLPLFEAIIHRVRKCRVLGSAAQAERF